MRTDTLRYADLLAKKYGGLVEQKGSILDVWRSHVHSDDWPTLQSSIQNCISGTEAWFSCEHRRQSSTGEWLWIQCRGSVIGRDHDGRALRLIGIDTDISVSRRMQEDLLEAGGISNAVFELLPQYLAVLDAQARVVRTNAVWNAHALASGQAYRNGYLQCPFADLLDSLTGGNGAIKREALAGIDDVIVGKVPTFKLEYSFVAATHRRWFSMLVMSAHGAQARAVVSHQEVTRLKGDHADRAAY